MIQIRTKFLRDTSVIQGDMPAISYGNHSSNPLAAALFNILVNPHLLKKNLIYLNLPIENKIK